MNLDLRLPTTLKKQSMMKKVLVTGGNKGIGFGICHRLLKDYSDVFVLLGSRDAGRGQAAVDKLTKEEGCDKSRVELCVIDVNDQSSITAAAKAVDDASLYGLICNAGIGFGHSLEDVLMTNYWGVRHATDAFLPKLQPKGGRIIVTSSAAGPMYCSSKNATPELKEKFGKPWTTSIDELDEIAKTYKLKSDLASDARGAGFESYGLSKALASAYAYLLAKKHPDLVINSQTPGFIETDLTKDMGATKTPWEGAWPAIYLLMDEQVAKLPQGRFYGSDCKRSPLDVYRDPGDPEYEGPDGPYT